MRQTTVALRWATRLLVVCAAHAGAGYAHDDVPDANSASLRTTYAALQDKLGQNQFQRPLYLDSSEAAGVLKGEIHAIVDYPFHGERRPEGTESLVRHPEPAPQRQVLHRRQIAVDAEDFLRPET
jgi:hypothetical protein